MKRIRLFQLQLVGLFLAIVFFLLLIPDTNNNAMHIMGEYQKLNTDWNVKTNSVSSRFDVLPSMLHVNSENEVWISRSLNNISDGNSLVFFSFEQQVRVYIDGEEIYSFVPSNSIKSKTPGNKWNFIPLSSDLNNKTLTINIVQCYHNNRIYIPTFYYGPPANITLGYLRTENFRIFLSFILILFGFAILFICFIFRKKKKFLSALFCLACFSISKGVWSIIESNTYSFFFTNYLLFSHISYLSLKIAVASYLLFINYTFHYGTNKFFKYLIYFSMLDFWLSIFLQYSSILDFAYSVFLTHAIMLTSGIFIIIDAVKHYKEHTVSNLFDLTKNRKKTYFTHVLCTCIISILSLCDLVSYYTCNTPDIARFSRIGDFIYICAISISLAFDFFYLIKTGQEADKIKEQAQIDPMTRLLNRSCFEKEIDEIPSASWDKYSIVVLDLNNLKLFNDKYGHNVGDYYIIVCSEIIQDFFYSWGKVFRIGGDEFCVIAKDLKKNDFELIQSAMYDHLKSLHTINHHLEMDISSGYASFDQNIDSNLRNTMKRADAAMYSNKSYLKKIHKFSSDDYDISKTS